MLPSVWAVLIDMVWEGHILPILKMIYVLLGLAWLIDEDVCMRCAGSFLLLLFGVHVAPRPSELLLAEMRPDLFVS